MEAIFAPPTKLVPTSCIVCGIEFGLPNTYRDARISDANGFYCPNGHSLSWGKSAADKLREQLAAKDRELAAAKSRAETERTWRQDAEAATARVERSLRATRAVVTRTKKKIVAGRCPCCSHKFKDLATHMTTRHPNYDPEKAVAAIEGKVAP